MIFPIGDDQIKGGHKPIFSYSLIAINILVFGYQVSLYPPECQQLFLDYGIVPVDWLDGERRFTILSSMFLHGGWLHLLGNMVFLWVFADNIEAVIGSFALLFFIC